MNRAEVLAQMFAKVCENFPTTPDSLAIYRDGVVFSSRRWGLTELEEMLQWGGLTVKESASAGGVSVAIVANFQKRRLDDYRTDWEIRDSRVLKHDTIAGLVAYRKGLGEKQAAMLGEFSD